jgi:hypothetical protein
LLGVHFDEQSLHALSQPVTDIWALSRTEQG